MGMPERCARRPGLCEPWGRVFCEPGPGQVTRMIALPGQSCAEPPQEDCPACDGSGVYGNPDDGAAYGEMCWWCGATGQVSRKCKC